MLKKILTSTLLLTSLLSQTAYCGGESSGGPADEFTPARAWFTSEDPSATITTCLEVSSDFGIDAETLKQMVVDSFQLWSTYLASKKLNGAYDDQIVSSLNFIPTCAPDTPLRFYFGVSTEEVIIAKTKYQDVLGDSERFDNGDISTGFVWISSQHTYSASDWARTPETLRALLLHEIGHVFGNNHVPETIMRLDIANLIRDDFARAPAKPFVARYLQIDGENELIPCLNCQQTYLPADTFELVSDDPSPHSDWKYTFSTLVGREPVGNVSLRYDEVGNPQGSGKLVVSDSLNSYSFAIQTQFLHRELGPAVFSNYRGSEYYNFSEIFSAAVQTLLGTSLELSVAFNMDDQRFSISVVNPDGSYPRYLFVAKQL